MINLNNESIVNVTKTYESVFSYVATFRDNIFYTDCNDDSVTCIDFQGNTRSVFKNTSVLQNPSGISVDENGNVYIAGADTNNVVDALLREINTKEEEESNKIRRILKSLIDKEKEITENQTNIGNIKQYASELQTFLSLKHIETNVVVAEQYIQSIVKSDEVWRWRGDFRQKDKQAQMMVAVTPMTIDSLAPTLLQKYGTKLAHVLGCTFLPDCKMVLKELIAVFKSDGSLDFFIGSVDPVFDMTYIGDNSVAVTSGYLCDYLQINLIDLETRNVTKTLKVNSVNSGVAYKDNKLIYCAKENGIKIINLDDESIINLTKTKVTVFSYATTFKDNIFYTHCDDDSVTCIDFQGNTQWVFKNESVIRNPLGISVDVSGNVYVVGGGSNYVVVTSPKRTELYTAFNN
ncbi:unnamed protein product [Mytilus edulis]|uniref:Uncharacterized protein n=1 Tax=Mytilus edulis TaxID=6550 RepID=A0A8S3U270_MYTED|nr:unnamed protein product [Mytilus edulis]